MSEDPSLFIRVTARRLKEHTPDQTMLTRYVVSQVHEIEQSLKEAARAHSEELCHRLDTNFDVRRMTNAAAQRYVYSSIIDQLERAGYTVAFSLTARGAAVRISWHTDEDRAEVARRDAIIAQASRRNRA